MPTVPVYILAGGKSSRFGSDKARADMDGRPLLLRIIESVHPIASSVTVVADAAGRYAELGVRTIADVSPGGGPMSGLQTALHDCPEPWMLMLSCDLITVRPAWIEQLLTHRRDDARVIAFRHAHWEPLMALYHQRLRPQVDQRLEAGHRRMQALLDDVDSAAVALPADWPVINQANTPADLAAALAQGDSR
jgi:molybdenum cofactor guanylyltransferase